MKKIAVIVTTPPTSHLTKTALDLVKHSAEEHDVIGVFFYQQGVLNGSSSVSFPSDELNITTQWQSLSSDLKIPLHLCSTAAEKLGLLCYEESGSEIETNLHANFSVSGLGELVVLINNADRIVQL